MYIFVNDDGLVHTNSNIKNVKCFSEYGLKYNNINFKSTSNDNEELKEYCKNMKPWKNTEKQRNYILTYEY